MYMCVYRYIDIHMHIYTFVHTERALISQASEIHIVEHDSFFYRMGNLF